MNAKHSKMTWNYIRWAGFKTQSGGRVVGTLVAERSDRLRILIRFAVTIKDLDPMKTISRLGDKFGNALERLETFRNCLCTAQARCARHGKAKG